MKIPQTRKKSIARERKAQVDARRELRKGFDQVINLITLGILRPEEAMDYVRNKNSNVDVNRISVRKKEYQLKLLQTIPGIGKSLAEVLLEEFGSLEAIADAKSEDIQMINGIAQAKARAIKENINGLLSEYQRIYS